MVLPRALAIAAVLLSAFNLSADDLVTVDLAVNHGPATCRASGFLHALSATEPADQYLNPLKPRLVRADPDRAVAIYNRLSTIGCKVQSLLSDGWAGAGHGYVNEGLFPGDNGDWSTWEDFVTNTVTAAGARNFQWDIWNEPNISYFWKRDFNRLCETWQRAYQIIRGLKPTEKIVGPSIDKFDQAYLQSFLTFCKTNNVLPDILSWHEFNGSATAEAHVAAIKGWMNTNGIAIPSIQINEYVRDGEQYHPGILADYFAAFERAGIENACHACWDDGGTSNCWSNTLDGILNIPDRLPRATWWVYKSYADITGQITGITPTAYLDGVAGLDNGAQVLRMVLGRQGGSGTSTVQIDNLSSAACFNGAGALHVAAERIPNSGSAALTGPIKELETDVTVQNDAASVNLPNFGSSDAYRVVITSTGSPTGVVTPAISPAGGNFNDSVIVTVSCATAGAEIRYTIDGNDPTGTSALYTGPLTLRNTTTFKARGFKSGLTASAVAAGVFTKNPWGPNLALDKPVTASSAENSSLAASHAVDGDMGTRWSSGYSDPQWITVDLGNPYTIETVVLNWEAAYGLDYRIEVSSNGTDWTTVYTQTNGTGGIETLTLTGPESGRYLRLYGTARGTPYGYSLWELEVYGAIATPVREDTRRRIRQRDPGFPVAGRLFTITGIPVVSDGKNPGIYLLCTDQNVNKTLVLP